MIRRTTLGRAGFAPANQLQPAARPQPRPFDVYIDSRLDPAERIGQKDHVGLQPFGLVQVHQADDVRAPGLER